MVLELSSGGRKARSGSNESLTWCFLLTLGFLITVKTTIATRTRAVKDKNILGRPLSRPVVGPRIARCPPPHCLVLMSDIQRFWTRLQARCMGGLHVVLVWIHSGLLTRRFARRNGLHAMAQAVSRRDQVGTGWLTCRTRLIWFVYSVQHVFPMA